jgi:hypothetical protein
MPDRTIDVGYVHVLTEPGGECQDTCPHPSHSAAPCEAIAVLSESVTLTCSLPDGHMDGPGQQNHWCLLPTMRGTSVGILWSGDVYQPAGRITPGVSSRG